MRGARRGGEAVSVAESSRWIYLDRRRAGLLRRPRPPARPDRLLAVARPHLRARRSGQPRAATRWPRCAACAASATRRPACSATTTAPARGGRTACAPRARERHARRRSWRRPIARPGSTGCASRRMAVHEHGWLMVHAGVVPQWDLALTLELAGEVERRLRSEALGDFLQRDVRQRAGALGRRRSPAPTGCASASTC